MRTTELATATVVDAITAVDQVGPSGQRLFDTLISESISRELAADARLVYAELATNAFEHGHAPSVCLAVSVSAIAVELQMKYVDIDVAPDPNDAVMPPPTSQRGRGLAMVAMISSGAVRSVVDGVTVTDITLDRI